MYRHLRTKLHTTSRIFSPYPVTEDSGSTGPQSRPRQARQGLHAALLQTADEARRRTKMLAGAFG